jgi:antitoxin HigA-1
MPMLNPLHPGEIVREECLKPLGLSVTAAAKALGVSRKALSELVNERSGISAMMALRLTKAFGGEPETWLGVQLDWDLAQARRRRPAVAVKRIRRPPLQESRT